MNHSERPPEYGPGAYGPGASASNFDSASSMHTPEAGTGYGAGYTPNSESNNWGAPTPPAESWGAPAAEWGGSAAYSQPAPSKGGRLRDKLRGAFNSESVQGARDRAVDAYHSPEGQQVREAAGRVGRSALEGAIDSTGVVKNGKVSKFRVAKLAAKTVVNPAGTVRQVAKGAAQAAYTEGRAAAQQEGRDLAHQAYNTAVDRWGGQGGQAELPASGQEWGATPPAHEQPGYGSGGYGSSAEQPGYGSGYGASAEQPYSSGGYGPQSTGSGQRAPEYGSGYGGGSSYGAEQPGYGPGAGQGYGPGGGHNSPPPITWKT